MSKFTKAELINSLIGEQDAIKITKTEGIDMFVSDILTSRNQAHVFHLQTKSYAEHKALGSYYEGIGDLIDGFVESYQGKYGILNKYDCEGIENYNSSEQVVSYFNGLADTIEVSRKEIKDSYLQNQVDTILELIYSTLYKLKYLS